MGATYLLINISKAGDSNLTQSRISEGWKYVREYQHYTIQTRRGTFGVPDLGDVL